MMRKTVLFLVVPAMITVLMTGCSSNMTSSTMTPPAGTVPVSLSMTDDPPAGVSVLFFQVQLTNATLTPATGSPVSLLSNNTPIQIDVTQLQALTAFLSTANVQAGTYKSLSMTFANPQLVIFNRSDTSIASTCAVGTVCKLTPAFDSNSSTLSISSSPFPVTVSSTSPLGLVIDFHLNTVIQPDLSVDLSATNGVSVSTLPPVPEHPHFGFLTGTVESVNATNNQFMLQTNWGRTFTIDTTSGTIFSSFPSGACKTPGIGCLTQGQVVQVQISSVGRDDALTASQVSYVQPSNAQTVEGTIIRLTSPSTNGASAPPTGFVLMLHQNFNNDDQVPEGGEATVSLASNATYSIDANGFTLPSGFTFTGASSLAVGQNVMVTIEPGTLSNTGGGTQSNDNMNQGGWEQPQMISLTASSVGLETSQLTGMIASTDSNTQSFNLGIGGSMFFAPWPMLSTNALSFNVMTTNQTSYQGFSPDSFDGLANGELVSVKGWLFAAAGSGGSPSIVAQSVVMRPQMDF